MRARPINKLGVLKFLTVTALVTLLALWGLSITLADSHAIADGDVDGLIAAINDANDAQGPTTIELAAGGDYVLSEVSYVESMNHAGLPSITGNITIEGNGATIRRSDSPDTPEFHIITILSGGRLHLRDLTIRDGLDSHVGGIQNTGTLILTNSVVRDNATTYFLGARESAGGIKNDGTLTLNNSTVSGNRVSKPFGRGGGISNDGMLTINRSTIDDNHTYAGGGIANDNDGTLIITRSTISNNSAEFDGGGIRMYSGSLELVNSTVSGNWADFYGAGISNDGTVDITSSTITKNHSDHGGGGIQNYAHPVGLNRSLVAGNSSPDGPDLRANVFTGNDNLIGVDNASIPIIGDRNLIGVDPRLGPLQDNGGPTFTHALTQGSPAIDYIAASACTGETDQRGIPRPFGSGCDIGSVEMDQVVIPTLTITASSLNVAQGTEIPEIVPIYSGFLEDHSEATLQTAPTCTTEATSNSPVGSYATTCSGAVTDFYEVEYVPGTLTIYADRFEIPDGDVDSLIAAIESAEQIGEPTTIALAPGSHYVLTNLHSWDAGLPGITGTITIEGNGATIRRGTSATENFRIMTVRSSATVHLEDVTISDGQSHGGSGIWNDGALSLTGSTVSGNAAIGSGDRMGGGITNIGTLTLTNSTVSGNSAARGGGGIANQGTLTLTNSTVSGNHSGNVGGGIFNEGGTLSLTNSTVSNNNANGEGGGIANFGNPVNLTGSLLASNTAHHGFDFIGIISPGSTYNLIGVGAGVSGVNDGENGNLIGIDPQLGPLADNGGPTLTHALLEGSRAIDHIPFAECVVGTDQRGVDRNVGNGCDVGAYESPFVALPVLTITASSPRIAVGDEIPEITPSYSGFRGGDSEASLQTVPTCTTEATSSSPAGTYSTSCFGAEIDGYEIVYVDGELTIYTDRIEIPDGDVDSLIAAIEFAEQTDELITIALAPGSHYVLTDLHSWDAGLPGITGTITIEGNGATIRRGLGATANFRIMTVLASATVHLEDVTISGGHIHGGSGVWNDGTLSLTGSTVSGNVAYGPSGRTGGGITNIGTLTLTNSTVSGNYSVEAGGGIFNEGTLTLTNSTVSNNDANYEGGGIANFGSPVNLTGSLLAGNTAFYNSDFAGPVSPGSTYNLIGVGAGVSGVNDGENGNLIGIDPQLGPLADNGGPTFTHALLEGSPAIDRIPFEECAVESDQRGVDRNLGYGCDVGAYESPFVALPVLTITASSPRIAVGDEIPEITPSYSGFRGGDSEASLQTAPTCTTEATSSSPAGTYETTCANAESDRYEIVYVPGTLTLFVDRYEVAASDVGDLIQAFEDAIGGGEPATIVLAANSIYELTDVHSDGTGLPPITGEITIEGNGSTIRGGAETGNFRIFTVRGEGTLHLIDLTVADGFRPNGGGIFNNGTVVLTNSTVTGNSASSNGAGMINNGSLTLVNSTVSGNTGSGSGGGLFIGVNGNARLINSTISANSANAGGGIFNAGGALEVVNTLVAGNEANDSGPDISGNVTVDGGFNLIGDSGGMNGLSHDTNGNLVGIDPRLGSLADNGGPTFTHALLSGSPAIDHIPFEDCVVDTDQRGTSRQYGDGCDIGAYESDVELPVLTIIASSPTMIYGDDVPEIAPTYDGFVGEDSENSLDAEPICTTEATSSSPVGTYETTCADAEVHGYTIVYETGTLTVEPAPLTVVADDQSMTYGGDVPAFTWSASGLLNDDAADIITGVVCSAVDVQGDPISSATPAGAYEITCDGASSPNYEISYQPGTLTIGQVAITVRADDLTRSYGETSPDFVLEIVDGGLVGSDSISDLGTPVFSTDPSPAIDAGTYWIDVSGLAHPSYAISYADGDDRGQLTIEPRAITVTADSQSKVYGDDDPVLTYQVTSGEFVGDDTLTGELDRVSGENAGSYAIGQGTLSGGNNYDITFEGADLTIVPRALGLYAGPQSKIYGDPDPELTYVIISGELVDGDAVVGELAREEGETVGSYEISFGTLSAGDNYTLGLEAASLTIEPRAIIVTADPQSKQVGEEDPALTWTISEGSLAFDDELTGELERDPGEDAGEYIIRQGTLNAGPNYAMTFNEGVLTITSGIGVCLDFDNEKAKKAGSVVPIRLMLCDSDGNNLSSTEIVVRAVGLEKISNGTNSELDPTSAGNSNPDNDFRFADGRYIYNLSTKGMSQGTWKLTFTVDGNASPDFAVEIQLRK